MGERFRELGLLVAGDAACFIAALWLTLTVRYLDLPSLERLNDHLGPFLILTGVWLFLFYSAGLYDKHTLLLKRALTTRLLYTQLTNFIIAAILFLVLPFGIAPKTNLVIYIVISTGLLSWWRLVGASFVRPRERKKAILIADGPEAVELVDEINNNDRYNYSFVRIIDKSILKNTKDYKEKLMRLIEKENISIVVMNRSDKYSEELMPQLFESAFLQFECVFVDFLQLYENTFDKVPVSMLGYEWFFSHISRAKSPVYDFIKRSFDLFGVAILAIPTAVLFPFVALAIKLDDQGPLFYHTDRVGQFNSVIKIYKFRTKNGRDAGADALKSTLQDTRVGVFLRKTRLDELPQLYNVLVGDLSFIGPRPEMPALAEVYREKIPYYNARHLIKPGLSGWAQINDLDAPRGGVDVERTISKLSYDLLYIKRRSIVLDVQIAIKTLATLVMRSGK